MLSSWHTCKARRFGMVPLAEPRGNHKTNKSSTARWRGWFNKSVRARQPATPYVEQPCWTFQSRWIKGLFDTQASGSGSDIHAVLHYHQRWHVCLPGGTSSSRLRREIRLHYSSNTHLQLLVQPVHQGCPNLFSRWADFTTWKWLQANCSYFSVLEKSHTHSS